jgi:hypothetical protein
MHTLQIVSAVVKARQSFEKHVTQKISFMTCNKQDRYLGTGTISKTPPLNKRTDGGPSFERKYHLHFQIFENAVWIAVIQKDCSVETSNVINIFLISEKFYCCYRYR